jgi:hypothetical protein
MCDPMAVEASLDSSVPIQVHEAVLWSEDQTRSERRECSFGRDGAHASFVSTMFQVAGVASVDIGPTFRLGRRLLSRRQRSLCSVQECVATQIRRKQVDPSAIPSAKTTRAEGWPVAAAVPCPNRCNRPTRSISYLRRSLCPTS